MASASMLVTACTSGGPSKDSSSLEGRDPDEHSSAADLEAADGDAETPSPTEPPGSQVDQVQPFVEGLLARYDVVVNKIVADPSVAGDEENPLVEEFLRLFEPGSEFARASLDGWVHQEEDGIVLKPSSPDFPVNVSNLDGAIQMVGDDEVQFAQCAALRYVMYEDGIETQRVELQLLPGEGRAVRLDGKWLLAELSTPPDLQGCRSGSEAP